MVNILLLVKALRGSLKKDLKVIPPEIAMIILEYLPRKRGSLICRESYRRSLENVKCDKLLRLLLIIFTAEPRHHRYFHEELIKIIVRKIGIKIVISSLYELCPKNYLVPIIRPYIIMALKNKTEQNMSGKVFLVPSLSPYFDIFLGYITVDLEYVAEYTIRTRDLYTFEQCLLHTFYNDPQRLVDLYNYADGLHYDIHDRFTVIFMEKIFRMIEKRSFMTLHKIE